MTAPDPRVCECGHLWRDHVGRYSTGRPLCIVCGCRERPGEPDRPPEHE